MNKKFNIIIENKKKDFGVETLTNLIKQTNFPWLISNVLDKKTHKPLVENAKTKHVIKLNDKISIGLIGLVEQEWIETLSSIKNEDIIYESFVSAGQRLADELIQIDVNYILILKINFKFLLKLIYRNASL